MPLTDLKLELLDTGYDLVGVTDDEVIRVRDRWITQFLSQLVTNRGSLFMAELAAGQITTNSDVMGLFALSAAQIIQEMNQVAQEIYTYRAELNTFTFIEPKTIQLQFTVFTDRGNITNQIVASA